MNNPTRWDSKRIDDNTVQFYSEHTVTGSIVVTATKQDGTIVWDKPNDVPYLVAEQAAVLLGV